MKTCECGCGALLRRTRSLALCKAASARLKAIYRQRIRGLGVVEAGRAHYAIYSSAERARAALAAGS